jgi:hypothetical protein
MPQLPDNIKFVSSSLEQTAAKRRQPSKAARRRVKESFDADLLIDICQRDAHDFGQYADFVALPDRVSKWGADRDRFYWYADNGSNILAVAHLDTVQDNRMCSVTDTGAGLLACSGALDDRLGAYVILEMLPELGINTDILLTTNEECGASTASAFRPPEGKKYNWIIEFDRGGTDVVMYQYETHAFATLVEESGARMGIGSYSDIACLEELGCAAFNWGVGYQDYHSARGHAWLEDTFRMVARFEKFWKANHATHLPYEPYENAWWDDKDDDAVYIVADCGDEIDLCDDKTYVECEDGKVVCKACGTPPSLGYLYDVG